MNTLYYGDNLEILKRYVKDETVDLVYLDPPFNSNQDYNVLFAEQNGSRSPAQVKVFEDSWRWDRGAAEAYEQTVETGSEAVAKALKAFRDFLGESDMMAYLAMMAPRLVELRRVLKPTGSIYLHCDPTASHYLKMLMDAVLGPGNFWNEIVWKRTSGHSDARRYGRVHDIILYYSKGESPRWNRPLQDYDAAYVEQYYRYKGKDGRRFMSGDLGAAGLQGGGYDYEWKGVRRVWRVPRESMERLDRQGRVFYTRKGIPRIKRYLDEAKGLPAQDVWADIEALRSWHAERLGYPTQKPEALLDRIIEAGSDEGDTVLDPFCGCGTTIAVAQRLKRPWIGIDITHLAVTLIKHRLETAFGKRATYTVVGEPVSLPDARALAEQDKFQFQAWALGLVKARPGDVKKGADRGIDGRKLFHDKPGGMTKQIILSVKGGHTSVKDLRDLRGVVEREKAEIGVLITLEEPTKPMMTEANGAGFYSSPAGKRYPKLQVRTIEQLLNGKDIEYPPEAQRVDATFKRAPAALLRVAEPRLPLGGGEEE